MRQRNALALLRGLDQRYLKFIGLSDDAIDFFWTDPMSHMIEKC